MTQTALKLTANPTKQTFYQSQSKDRQVEYRIDLTSPANAKLDARNVEVGNISLWQNALKNQAEDISFRTEDAGRTLVVYVTLKDPAQLAAGRSYTLPLLIRASGSATNMAATTVNLTLTVQK